jgi:colicin import membrane protein
MVRRNPQRRYPFVLSVLGHAAMVAALTFSLPLSSPKRPAAPNVIPIEAVMIDTAALRQREEAERIAREELERIERQQREADARARAEAEAETQRQKDAALQQQREADAEARRLQVQRDSEAAEKLRVQQEQEAKAKADAERLEQERIAAEKKREEEERLKREAEAREQKRLEEERVAAAKAAAEQRRLDAIEAEIARAIAEESAAREAEESGLVEQWARQIENKIQQRWIRPPSAETGLECVVAVTQIPDGTVTSVSVERCNGDDAVKRSVENAVWQASPLPPPPVPQIFMRNIRVTFRPDE